MKRIITSTVMACGLAGISQGCLGIEVMGFPLGPNMQNGLEATGVIAHQPGGCVYPAGSASPIYLLEGAMEVGTANTSPNTYTAVVNVHNTRPSNQTATPSPNHQNQYGNSDTDAITIINANVRYEYPTLDAAAHFLLQQPIATGLVPLSQTNATGDVASGSFLAVPVVLMDQTMSRKLAKDSTFKKRLARDGHVPVVVHMQLEGRTHSGARAFSNDLTYKIDLFKSGTLTDCTCPPGLNPQFNPDACFPGQDVNLCTGSCI